MQLEAFSITSLTLRSQITEHATANNYLHTTDIASDEQFNWKTYRFAYSLHSLSSCEEFK